jgi:hypothetical protein
MCGRYSAAVMPDLNVAMESRQIVVHRAYAKRAAMKISSLEDYEQKAVSETNGNAKPPQLVRPKVYKPKITHRQSIASSRQSHFNPSILMS